MRLEQALQFLIGIAAISGIGITVWASARFSDLIVRFVARPIALAFKWYLIIFISAGYLFLATQWTIGLGAWLTEFPHAVVLVSILIPLSLVVSAIAYKQKTKEASFARRLAGR